MHTDQEQHLAAYRDVQDDLLCALADVRHQTDLLLGFDPEGWSDSADLEALRWQVEMFTRLILSKTPLEMLAGSYADMISERTG